MPNSYNTLWIAQALHDLIQGNLADSNTLAPKMNNAAASVVNANLHSTEYVTRCRLVVILRFTERILRILPRIVTEIWCRMRINKGQTNWLFCCHVWRWWLVHGKLYRRPMEYEEIIGQGCGYLIDPNT